MTEPEATYEVTAVPSSYLRIIRVALAIVCLASVLTTVLSVISLMEVHQLVSNVKGVVTSNQNISTENREINRTHVKFNARQNCASAELAALAVPPRVAGVSRIMRLVHIACSHEDFEDNG